MEPFVTQGNRHRYSRRRCLALTSGATALLMGACAPAGPGQPQTVKERQPVTLRDQRGSTPGSAVALSDEAIKLKHPWLTVVHEGGGSSSAEAMAKLVVMAASGDLPDIIYAQGTQIQYYISQKIVISLSPYLAKDKEFDLADFPKVAVEMYSRGGQVYAIPYDHGPNMLWYNADLFAKHGVAPPHERWTWDDLVLAARQLTVERDGQWGLMDNGPRGQWTLLSYLAPWGAYWVDDAETKTTIDSTQAVNAMQYFMDLYFKHKVAPVPGTYVSAWNNPENPFLAGKVAMVLGGPWTIREWIGKVAFQTPIADWPIGPAGKRVSSSMGSGYPITTTSKHPDEAWLYVSEFLGKDIERSMMGQFVKLGTGTPVRFSLMKEYEKSSFAPPNAQIIAPSANYSLIGRPISPIKADLDLIWAEEMAALWQQSTTVKDMLSAVQRRMVPVLERNKAGF
jgi:multiple sugar transport system substrate-binding protein